MHAGSMSVRLDRAYSGVLWENRSLEFGTGLTAGSHPVKVKSIDSPFSRQADLCDMLTKAGPQNTHFLASEKNH